MDIAIVGRHTKVSEDMRQKIFERMEKVESLAPRATRAEINVVHERNPRLASDRERVEITLHDHGVIRAEAAADDRHVALERASARIVEQLRRQHERRAKRHNSKPSLHAVVAQDLAADGTDARSGSSEEERVESVESWEGAPHDATVEVPVDGTPITIRSKTHKASPITVAEAIDQMELVGHDFYLFLDADSGLASAVYRRRGWTYGVIRIEDETESAGRESA
ncbi:ribosome hibernation-promoting factor, HPF/YfiA family [Demequina activiva]|uniref:Ribosome hibernation promoting factor n=1 Tax=Demequina activiva TaxID=1582364 RepID=A0A919UHG3_9MICO|nr:ribosome-associated translation inhibitor RaiA [Demequina activiva]GIG55404.1 ribosomal subunit interface protein [Demequina activiva]